MRKWHHGHSLATGVLFGLMLDQKAVVIAGGAFVVGMVARESYTLVRYIGGSIGRTVDAAFRYWGYK